MSHFNAQVINASGTEEEKELFNKVFGLIVLLSVSTLRSDKKRVSKYEEYTAELNNSGKFNKRTIKILGWEVGVTNYTFIKSNCPHMTVMLRDALLVLEREQLRLKKLEGIVSVA